MTIAASGRWVLYTYSVADDRHGGSSIDVPLKKELKAIHLAGNASGVPLATQVDFERCRPFRTHLIPGSRDWIHFDPENDHFWKGVVDELRLSPHPDSTLGTLASTTELPSASPRVFAEFLEASVSKVHAPRTALFLHGHAAGPMGLFYDNAGAAKQAHRLRLHDLAGAIRSAPLVDGRVALVFFRDCFMNTLETAYEFRDAAEFLVASQSLMPKAGVWPWEALLTAMKSMEQSPTGDAADDVVGILGAFAMETENRGPFLDAPLTLIDTTSVAAVVEPLRALADLLDGYRGGNQEQACAVAINRARIGYPGGDAEATNPGDPALLDVPTLCENLLSLGIEALAGPAAALRTAVIGNGHATTRPVVRRHWCQSEPPRFRGVSLYCRPDNPEDIDASYMESFDPGEQVANANYYSALSLSRATGWERIALNPLVEKPHS